VSRHRQPGRRRAPGRVKRLPDGFPRSGAAWAAKSVAGLGVLGGAAVALTLPLESAAEAAAAPASLALSAQHDGAAQQARTADRASRSTRRALPAAVAAPAGVSPAHVEAVGVTGVTAVAKPAPKTATPSTASASVSSAAANAWSGNLNPLCTGIGLILNAERLCSAVRANFTPSTVGGYRPNAGEHSTGQAVDIMITSQAQGDAIAAWVQSHVGQFNVKYVIWRQRYWEPGSSWRLMEDRGSPTANHYDHVHVTVNY
jgi:hypothetical protein